MSRNQKWREEFIYRASQEGIPLHVARKVLRHAATLHRLAEAQCNGDWPADNGERKVVPCTLCGGLWVRSSMARDRTQQPVNGFYGLICKDCRTEQLVTELLAPYPVKAYFAGDPRGCVVTIVKASVSREDFESGRERGIGVPS